jgi:hypothetical protein
MNIRAAIVISFLPIISCLPASAYLAAVSETQGSLTNQILVDSFQGIAVSGYNWDHLLRNPSGKIVQGIAANGYDWVHIFKNHSPSGEVAKQRLKANPDYIYSIFQNMTDNQIKSCVQRAWKERKKVETQEAIPPATARRIKYRAYDAETKYTLFIWQNEDTGYIETAFPIKATP